MRSSRSGGGGRVTAYTPFLGRAENQSEQVLRGVIEAGGLPADWEASFWPAVLPPLAARVATVLESGPRAWLALGEAGTEGPASLETVAHNSWDLTQDPEAAAGGSPAGRFEAEGPERIRAHWPAAALAAHLQQLGEEVVLSEDAGRHCCNGLLWLATRQAAAVPGPRPWIGFLHLPRRPEERPDQVRLVARCLDWIARQPR